MELTLRNVVDEALINCNRVFSLPSASVENIRGFDQWIQDNQPLVGAEQKFLQDHGELVAMKEDLFQQGPVIKLARFMAGKVSMDPAPWQFACKQHANIYSTSCSFFPQRYSSNLSIPSEQLPSFNSCLAPKPSHS